MIARQALGAVVLHLECNRNGLADLDAISDVPFESGLGATPWSAVAIDTEVVEIGASTFVDMKQHPFGIHAKNRHGEIWILFIGRSYRGSHRRSWGLGNWWGGTAMEQKGEPVSVNQCRPGLTPWAACPRRRFAGAYGERAGIRGIGRAPAGMLSWQEREEAARFQGERETIEETIDEAE
jgi:hypothetical protein